MKMQCQHSNQQPDNIKIKNPKINDKIMPTF